MRYPHAQVEVRVTGFEPAASRSQTERSTKLSYTRALLLVPLTDLNRVAASSFCHAPSSRWGEANVRLSTSMRGISAMSYMVERCGVPDRTDVTVRVRLRDVTIQRPRDAKPLCGNSRSRTWASGFSSQRAPIAPNCLCVARTGFEPVLAP